MFPCEDDAGGRAFGFEATEEAFECGPRTLSFNHETRIRIQYPTRQPDFGGESINEGPEAYTLHRAIERYAEADCRAALRR
jgi:hypothetical protein